MHKKSFTSIFVFRSSEKDFSHKSLVWRVKKASTAIVNTFLHLLASKETVPFFDIPYNTRSYGHKQILEWYSYAMLIKTTKIRCSKTRLFNN